MFILPTVSSFCQNSYLAFVAVHYIFKWYLWNTEDTILSPQFESFLNHTILKRLFNSKREIPSCLYRPDAERLNSNFFWQRKVSAIIDGGTKNCRQWDQKLLTERRKKVQMGAKNWRNWSKKLATDEPGGTKKARQEKKWTARGWVCWLRLQFVCLSQICVAAFILQRKD